MWGRRGGGLRYDGRPCQNLVVGRGTQASLSGMNYIKSVRAERDRKLSGKVLVKKQPKH